MVDKVTAQSKKEGFKPNDIPLVGKLRIDVDPIFLGSGDFQKLINMRYTNNNPRGMLGMSKVNAAAMDYTRVDNGFHFRKDQPSESHVFAQTTSGSNSKLKKSNNTSLIPSQDTFADFQTLSGNNTTFFSNAPDGCMVALNGNANYIWGGNESRVAKFIVFDPGGSFWYDYTEKVNNTLTDSANSAIMPGVGGGIDANTVMDLHLDNNVTDSSLAPKTVTNNNVTFANTDVVFGSHIAIFNGVNADLTIPDDADFNFSGGTWTVDGRFKLTSLAAVNPLYYQQTDANTYMTIYVDTSGFIHLVIHTLVGGDIVALVTNTALVIDTWYHIAVVENGNNFYILVGPTGGTATVYAQTSSANRASNYTGVVQIGYNNTVYLTGKVDELRVSKTARWTGPFNVPLSAYSVTTTTTHVYIGSTRQLKGIKFYVGTPNTSAATVSGYQWTGAAFEALTGVVDGTSLGGKTLSTTETVSFDTTVGASKIKAIKNVVAYFYHIVFTSVDVATTIYYCTVDAPIQELLDIWDGSGRICLQCYKYTSSYTDYTINVYKADYLSTDPTTYAQFGTLTASQYGYFAFSERMMGLTFVLPDATYVNTTANSIMSVDYWSGSAWVSVGYVDDATSSGGISWNHSGTATWNGAAENTEFTTQVGNDNQFFIYRVHFSQTLSADVRIDLVTGIPVQRNFKKYRFPLVWQSRLWLIDDQSQYKNSVLGSSVRTSSVFNGTDCPELFFGDDKELVAGSSLFTRYGGTLYDNMILFKREAIFLVDGIDPSSYAKGQYTVSDSVGCIAPLTLRKCDVSFEVAPGITKRVLLWQSARGIEYFDGNTVTLVSDDIKTFFDPDNPNYINIAIVDQFSASYDEKNYEYHWCFATGSSTTLNQEWVFDLLRKKWYEVNRGTGKALRCGWNVVDVKGNQFSYAGTTDGFIERLENGTTFDGNPITCTLRTGDSPLEKSMSYQTEIRHVKITGIAKNVTTQKVALTHFADARTSGTILPAISQADTAKRLFQAKRSVNQAAILHSFEMSISTTNELVGFEPIMISSLYRFVREDT